MIHLFNRDHSLFLPFPTWLTPKIYKWFSSQNIDSNVFITFDLIHDLHYHKEKIPLIQQIFLNGLSLENFIFRLKQSVHQEISEWGFMIEINDKSNF